MNVCNRHLGIKFFFLRMPSVLFSGSAPPSWHKNQRHYRSRARKAARLGFANQLQLSRLEAHHGSAVPMAFSRFAKSTYTCPQCKWTSERCKVGSKSTQAHFQCAYKPYYCETGKEALARAQQAFKESKKDEPRGRATGGKDNSSASRDPTPTRVRSISPRGSAESISNAQPHRSPVSEAENDSMDDDEKKAPDVKKQIKNVEEVLKQLKN